MQLPADVVNRSLDSIGYGDIIGSLEDGSDASEAARRIYGPTLRQLLRTAYWSSARKEADLLLLGDATGLTLDPSGVPISQAVEQPWTYCYAWPNDAVAARWMPLRQGATVNPPAVPIMTNLGAGTPFAFNPPARFLLSTSDEFPAEAGQVDWGNLPDLPEGQGAITRRVVLTNQKDARLVYTQLLLDIDVWDSLFEEAMIATLASRLAMPLLVDKTAPVKDQVAQRNAAAGIRNAQIAIAKDAVLRARVASANEVGFPQSTDHVPDWIRARSGYGGYGRGIDGPQGPGVLRYGWESMAWGDGSVM